MRLRERIQIKFFEAYFAVMSFVERTTSGVSINLFDPDFIQNPYPHYNKLRSQAPVHYSIAARAWWVTKFDYVQEALTDKRFSANPRNFPERAEKMRRNLDSEQLEAFDNPSMLNLDPPDHSRIRRLATQGMTRKFIQSLEPRINDTVDRCLAKTDNVQSFDLVDVLAQPLPAIVIAEMMGLPESDHARFLQWSEDLVGGTGTNELAKLERAQLANRQLINYFRKVIQDRRDNPTDDLVGLLIEAEEAGDKLSEMELYNTCLLLLLAGHETTTRLISNGAYLLLKAPGQWQRLIDEPELIAGAVEEMLRFEPPVQATERFVLEDMDFHGHQFKRSDHVFLSIAGGNRDPAANEHPEAFRIDRPKVNQLSFGYGIHLCLGAALARLEAKVAFEKLTGRYPELSLKDISPPWGANPFFRGHDVLMVTKGAA